MATGDHDWVAGEILAAQNMDDFLQLQVVAQYTTTGARDTALSVRKRTGMITANADTRALSVYSGSAWSTVGPVYGASTTWTPVLSQSTNFSCTINHESYTRTGRWIQGYARMTVASGGTVSNALAITLPAAANLTGSELMTLGTAMIKVSASGFIYYPELVVASSASFAYFQIRTNGAVAALYGINTPTLLAIGDQVSVNFAYEAAADA
jgi:hypothetical protein